MVGELGDRAPPSRYDRNSAEGLSRRLPHVADADRLTVRLERQLVGLTFGVCRVAGDARDLARGKVAKLPTLAGRGFC